MNKTLEDYKNEVAKKYNFEKWENVYYKTCFMWEDTMIGFEDMINEAAELYANAQLKAGYDVGLNYVKQVTNDKNFSLPPPLALSEEERAVIYKLILPVDLNRLYLATNNLNYSETDILKNVVGKLLNATFSK